MYQLMVFLETLNTTYIPYPLRTEFAIYQDSFALHRSTYSNDLYTNYLATETFGNTRFDMNAQEIKTRESCVTIV